MFLGLLGEGRGRKVKERSLGAFPISVRILRCAVPVFMQLSLVVVPIFMQLSSPPFLHTPKAAAFFSPFVSTFSPYSKSCCNPFPMLPLTLRWGARDRFPENTFAQRTLLYRYPLPYHFPHPALPNWTSTNPAGLFRAAGQAHCMRRFGSRPQSRTRCCCARSIPNNYN
jgi:hypothetical protein